MTTTVTDQFLAEKRTEMILMSQSLESKRTPLRFTPDDVPEEFRSLLEQNSAGQTLPYYPPLPASLEQVDRLRGGRSLHWHDNNKPGWVGNYQKPRTGAIVFDGDRNSSIGVAFGSLRLTQEQKDDAPFLVSMGTNPFTPELTFDAIKYSHTNPDYRARIRIPSSALDSDKARAGAASEAQADDETTTGHSASSARESSQGPEGSASSGTAVGSYTTCRLDLRLEHDSEDSDGDTCRVQITDLPMADMARITSDESGEYGLTDGALVIRRLLRARTITVWLRYPTKVEMQIRWLDLRNKAWTDLMLLGRQYGGDYWWSKLQGLDLLKYPHHLSHQSYLMGVAAPVHKSLVKIWEVWEVGDGRFAVPIDWIAEEDYRVSVNGSSSSEILGIEQELKNFRSEMHRLTCPGDHESRSEAEAGTALDAGRVEAKSKSWASRRKGVTKSGADTFGAITLGAFVWKQALPARSAKATGRKSSFTTSQAIADTASDHSTADEGYDFKSDVGKGAVGHASSTGASLILSPAGGYDRADGD